MERNRQCGYGTAGGGTCEQTAGFPGGAAAVSYAVRHEGDLCPGGIFHRAIPDPVGEADRAAISGAVPGGQGSGPVRGLPPEIRALHPAVILHRH